MFTEVCLCAFLNAGSCYRLHAAACELRHVQLQSCTEFTLLGRSAFIASGADLRVCTGADRASCTTACAEGTVFNADNQCMQATNDTWVAAGSAAADMCKIPQLQSQFALPGSNPLYIAVCALTAVLLVCLQRAS